MGVSSPFRRELSLLDLTMVSFGGIVGASWLLGAQRGPQIAGPAAIISWIVGGVAILLLGLVYSELGAMLPEAGAMVRFPQYSHGTLVSLLMGWTTWIAYAAVGTYEADAVVQYAANYLPDLFDSQHDVLTARGAVVAVLILVGFFVLNVIGVRIFARVNTTVTLIKLAVPALTTVALFAVAFHPGNFSAGGGFAPHGTEGILAAVSTAGVIPAFLGFRQAIALAGEARHPQRDIPRSLVLSIGIAGVLYVLLQACFIGALPASLVRPGWSALSFDAPYVVLASTLGLGWLANLLRFDAVVSPAGTGFVYTSTNARVAYALTRNGYVPEILGRIHPTLRVPHVALLVNLAFGLLFLLPFPSWSKLVGVVTDGILLTYLAGPVAALALRRTAPHADRPVRLPGLGLMAPISFVIAGLAIYWAGWPTVGVVTLLSLSGLLLYAYYTAKRHFPASHARAALWLIGYEIFLIVTSYLGSFGGVTVLPYGVDLVVVVVGSVVAFTAGVRSALAVPCGMGQNG